MLVKFDTNKISLSKKAAAYNVVVETNLYQQLNQTSNTIICIQYSRTELVSFRLKNVQQGNIIYDEVKGIGLLCTINKKPYFFTRHHLEQMSDREQSELFDHLKIDGSKIFVSLA